jgi:hypothetical protein
MEEAIPLGTPLARGLKPPHNAHIRFLQFVALVTNAI